VAVGNSGAIITSTNGITWTTRTAPATTTYSSLTYYNNTFIAIGGAVVATSTNGITWVASQSTPAAITANSLSVYNSTLLAAGTTLAYYSYDGYGYDSGFMAVPSLAKGIAGGAGYVVVGSNTMTNQTTGLTIKQVLNYNTATQFAVPNSSVVLASATSTTQRFYNLPIASQTNLYIKAT
jgi:hypothetical protein